MRLVFRHPHDKFQFDVSAVVQTPNAESIASHHGPSLYRLDQPGNPDGDTSKELALFDRQFVQVPIRFFLFPVHIYSNSVGGARR